MSGETSGNGSPTVVLVNGAFADASSWNGVIERLQERGVNVVAPANPLRGIASDSAYIATVLDQIAGPVIAVGHSYGGAVIIGAGTDPNVAALVYIAAFAPDEGESVKTRIADFPPDAPAPPMPPPQDGFLFLDREKFMTRSRAT